MNIIVIITGPALSKGPNRVGATFPLPDDGNRSSFQNVFFRTSDDGESPKM
jgi:hypothetical protein